MGTDANDSSKTGGDRWLVIIVAGIVLIVVVALLVVLTRPDVAYIADGTPEATVHNYLLALQKDDFERAHGYLSPTLPGYPDLAQFEQQVSRGWQFGQNQDASYAIEESDTLGDGRVRVKVRETRYSGSGPLGGYQASDQFELTLQEESEGWRLIDGDDYWHYCWDNEGCR